MSVTNPCKVREPKVINDELILECIHNQLPKGELGRLMKSEKVKMEEIEELRIEFSNIIKMDHLWMLKSLTKLKLNNNYIEKIENLETLVHLEDLDLAFNKIHKIENLSTLVNLRKLSLYDNLIENIENMENLKKLSILSIGKNKIANKEEIHNLRRCVELVSLNISHNPCESSSDFPLYVASFLPNLKYYEYRKIDEDDKERGKIIFQKAIKALEAEEQRILAKVLQKEREDREAELNMDSFVEYLNTRQLFEKMFEDDEDGKLLLHLGEDVKEYYDNFEENFIKLCLDVFDIGQKHYKIRSEDIEAFKESTENAKRDNQLESIQHMEAFIDSKNEIFTQTKTLHKHVNDGIIDEEEFARLVEVYTEKFYSLTHNTWKQLMKLELQLFEQLDEVNQTFEHILTEMINNFIEESQNCFTQLREAEAFYMEQVSEVANKMFSNIGIAEDLVIPEALTEVMSDKDNLLNCLGGTHDLHLQVIDDREDVLMLRSKNWLQDFIKNLYESEVQRNRYKILEVTQFLDIQKEEFEKLIAPPEAPPNTS